MSQMFDPFNEHGEKPDTNNSTSGTVHLIFAVTWAFLGGAWLADGQIFMPVLCAITSILNALEWYFRE